MKKLPTEFAINMYLEKLLILQQTNFKDIPEDFFSESNPCHIYFIFKRPRLTIVPDFINVTKEAIELKFEAHSKTGKELLQYKFENNLDTTDLKLKSDYPFNTFNLCKSDGEILVGAKVGPFLQSFTNSDHLNLEVLYIGQSYGTDGARTAPDRLVNHSTLQGIYAEAITNNPESEIWLGLCSFTQLNITVMSSGNYSKEELDADDKRRPIVMDKLNWTGINEQQRINFTEAALIKYFQPAYNKIYKDSFPNPAHKTYSECYDLDINSVGIEINGMDLINGKIFSNAVEPKYHHMESFFLHSAEDRKSIFDFFSK